MNTNYRLFIHKICHRYVYYKCMYICYIYYICVCECVCKMLAKDSIKSLARSYTHFPYNLGIGEQVISE